MKSKSSAILLTFFLGGLGAHKFYLGQNTAGVLYLLFSWTFIPTLIAFFDFFGLIFMSDSDFNTRYNGVTGSRSGAVSAKDATGALQDLKKLYDQDVITAEEYEEKRQSLLKHL